MVKEGREGGQRRRDGEDREGNKGEKVGEIASEKPGRGTEGERGEITFSSRQFPLIYHSVASGREA